MEVNIQIQLAAGESLPASDADAAATQVLEALGADPAVSYCVLNVATAPLSGHAGTPEDARA